MGSSLNKQKPNQPVAVHGQAPVQVQQPATTSDVQQPPAQAPTMGGRKHRKSSKKGKKSGKKSKSGKKR